MDTDSTLKDIRNDLKDLGKSVILLRNELSTVKKRTTIDLALNAYEHYSKSNNKSERDDNKDNIQQHKKTTETNSSPTDNSSIWSFKQWRRQVGDAIKADNNYSLLGVTYKAYKAVKSPIASWIDSIANKFNIGGNYFDDGDDVVSTESRNQKDKDPIDLQNVTGHLSRILDTVVAINDRHNTYEPLYATQLNAIVQTNSAILATIAKDIVGTNNKIFDLHAALVNKLIEPVVQPLTVNPVTDEQKAEQTQHQADLIELLQSIDNNQREFLKLSVNKKDSGDGSSAGMLAAIASTAAVVKSLASGALSAVSGIMSTIGEISAALAKWAIPILGKLPGMLSTIGRGVGTAATTAGKGATTAIKALTTSPLTLAAVGATGLVAGTLYVADKVHDQKKEEIAKQGFTQVNQITSDDQFLKVLNETKSLTEKGADYWDDKENSGARAENLNQRIALLEEYVRNIVDPDQQQKLQKLLDSLKTKTVEVVQQMATVNTVEDSQAEASRQVQEKIKQGKTVPKEILAVDAKEVTVQDRAIAEDGVDSTEVADQFKLNKQNQAKKSKSIEIDKAQNQTKIEPVQTQAEVSLPETKINQAKIDTETKEQIEIEQTKAKEAREQQTAEQVQQMANQTKQIVSNTQQVQVNNNQYNNTPKTASAPSKPVNYSHFDMDDY